MLPTTVVRGRANPRYLKFAARLSKARKVAGVSAEALSVAAGLSKGIVSSLETDAGVPRIYTVERLANALKMSPAFLAFGLDAPCDPPEDGALRCESLAARAKEARAARGLTLREVGQHAGAAFGAVRAIESGTMPGIDKLEAVATALGVSPGWLGFGIGPRETLRLRTRPIASALEPMI